MARSTETRGPKTLFTNPALILISGCCYLCGLSIEPIPPCVEIAKVLDSGHSLRAPFGKWDPSYLDGRGSMSANGRPEPTGDQLASIASLARALGRGSSNLHAALLLVYGDHDSRHKHATRIDQDLQPLVTILISDLPPIVTV